MRRPTFLAIVLAVLLLPASSGFAHSINSYYTTGRWLPTTTITFWFADHDFDAGGVAGQGSKLRIEEGHSSWNLSGVTARFSSRGYDYTLKSNCALNADNRNAIFWTPIDGTPPAGQVNVLALNEPCYYFDTLGNPTRLRAFVTTFDRDDLWHSGTNAPASGRIDVRGVATHEAGHAIGHRMHWDEVDDDFQTNRTLCSTSGYPHHTMCSKIRSDGGYEQRTLEAHDSHTAEAAY